MIKGRGSNRVPPCQAVLRHPEPGSTPGLGATRDSIVSNASPALPAAGDHPAAGPMAAVVDPARPVRRSFTAAYRA